ncbi:hypothetical protein K9U40_23455 [Xanthobacter autotrophicus]|uniref:hypothetical protein n=1 Tax=Xanthobacter autotrophicus TaxID=280 RepID=UPI0024AAC529|nr:hypothetical protein [Xanthobacter autotrophicus]MDI4667251.1 hypothetical protein [Xanthobacter autotrophicus]
MRPLALALTLASIGLPASAEAASRTEKVYAANGRRVAVIKSTNFGRSVYGPNGRRIAVIKCR